MFYTAHGMKGWLKYTWTSLLCLFCFSSNASEKIRVAYVDAPPYAYTDKDGRAKGLLIETFRELSLVLGTEPEFIFLPHRRQIEFIEKGKVDMWAGQINSKVNSNLALVSANPLFSMGLHVYWKKGTKPLKLLADLQDKHLVLISSYSYGGNYANLVNQSKTVTYAVSHEDGFDKLFAGRHKYLLGYQRISQRVIDKFQIQDVQHAQVAKYNLHVKLSKNYPNAPTLMQEIDAYLALENPVLITYQ